MPHPVVVYTTFMKRVLVFGESITLGCWDTEGGWVERLKREAFRRTVESEGKNKIQVFNLGVPSDTSLKILNRMENEIQARQSDSWGLKIVLSFGINDSRIKDGINQISIENFKNYSNLILQKAKKYTNDIIVVGTPSLGEPKILVKTFEFVDEQVRNYDMALEQLCKNQDIPFVNLRTSFMAVNNDLHVYDKIHLNSAGHELIQQVVRPYLFNTP